MSLNQCLLKQKTKTRKTLLQVVYIVTIQQFNFLDQSTSILKSLYYSIFHSHATYGLPVWRYVQKIKNIQKKSNQSYNIIKVQRAQCPPSQQSKNTQFKDLLYLKTASLLWNLDKGTPPSSLSSYFTRASSTHSQNTRFANSGNLKFTKDTNIFQ